MHILYFVETRDIGQNMIYSKQPKNQLLKVLSRARALMFILFVQFCPKERLK